MRITKIISFSRYIVAGFILVLMLCIMTYICIGKLVVNRSDNTVSIIVSKQDSLSSVTDKITHATQFPYPWLFKGYAVLQGVSRSIRLGEYDITPNLTIEQLIIKFITSDVVVHKFVLVEGWNKYELARALEKNPAVIHTLGPNLLRAPTINGSVEGAYYPDTYYFSYPDRDVDILMRASDKMEKVLTSAAMQSNVSYYDGLIIASLIEKETAQNDEKYLISGVIKNRLTKRMPIQIDASKIWS